MKEIIGLEQEEMKTCNLCYEESKESEFYSLKCQHEFCKLCHEDYLETAINEGKVINISCMNAGCPEEFNEDDVQNCVSEGLFNKYKRFQRNAMIDLDPNLRWCPEPTCDSYVRKSPIKG